MWQGYSIALRLAGPVHTGWRTFGNIRQTRPYVPGRTLWGAFAARLARDYMAKDYERAAGWVDRYIRFGYLFAAEGDPPVPVCRPWGSESGEFAWRYLNSYMSTALRDGRSKQDGSLHEMEYLAPFTREGRPVWLAGPLWVADSGEDRLEGADRVAGFLGSLAVGADRGYGWGRFREARVGVLAEGDALPGGEWRWQQVSEDLVVTNPGGAARLLSHVHLAQSDASSGLVDYSVEPLVGRTTPLKDGHRRAGADISAALFSAAPGSLASAGQRYKVGPRGVWLPVSA